MMGATRFYEGSKFSYYRWRGVSSGPGLLVEAQRWIDSGQVLQSRKVRISAGFMLGGLFMSEFIEFIEGA